MGSAAIVPIAAMAVVACRPGEPTGRVQATFSRHESSAEGARVLRPADPMLGSAPEQSAEEERGAGLSPETCRGWPSNASHPHAGIYVDDTPGLTPREGAMRVLFFDGSTVTLLYEEMSPRAAFMFAGGCPYTPTNQEYLEHFDDGRPPWRYHARVDRDGWLFVLRACRGWTPLGRFDGDHFDALEIVLRRLPDGSMNELYDGSRDALLLDLHFRCTEVYESRDAPIPPLPPVPRELLREHRRAQRRRQPGS
jgi:hypothetical protein